MSQFNLTETHEGKSFVDGVFLAKIFWGKFMLRRLCLFLHTQKYYQHSFNSL